MINNLKLIKIKMKQKVGFLETESAKHFLTTLKFSLSHFGEALMGAVWIGFIWLFGMFFY